MVLVRQQRVRESLAVLFLALAASAMGVLAEVTDRRLPFSRHVWRDARQEVERRELVGDVICRKVGEDILDDLDLGVSYGSAVDVPGEELE